MLDRIGSVKAYILESSAVAVRVSSPYIELIEVISSNNSSDISPEFGIVGSPGNDDNIPSQDPSSKPITFFSGYYRTNVKSE
jgi:hypothetical protein